MRFFKINNGLIKEMSYDDSSKKSELIEQADWIDAHEISEDGKRITF